MIESHEKLARRVMVGFALILAVFLIIFGLAVMALSLKAEGGVAYFQWIAYLSLLIISVLVGRKVLAAQKLVYVIIFALAFWSMLVGLIYLGGMCGKSIDKGRIDCQPLTFLQVFYDEYF